MARRRISHQDGVSAIERYREDPNQGDLATAVRYLLEELSEQAPGNSVEVRVAPYGATQCIQGPRHARGTPPNLVEMSPETWFQLAVGTLSWRDAIDGFLVSQSGMRADLSAHLPLWPNPKQRH
jgi:hypothetical protein